MQSPNEYEGKSISAQRRDFSCSRRLSSDEQPEGKSAEKTVLERPAAEAGVRFIQLMVRNEEAVRGARSGFSVGECTGNDESAANWKAGA
jgi:hypothetical protein